jgi:hypothetical protein
LANLTYVDLEDPSNPLEHFELFYAPEIADAIARETNQYEKKIRKHAQSKTRSRTNHWNETNRNEIMKLLAFCYNDFTRNQITCYFPQRKILETPIFLDLFSSSFC